MNLSAIEAEIETILSEYPSHPPMAGSEQGLNMVTVEKLSSLITQTAEAVYKECAEVARKLLIPGSAHMTSTEIGTAIAQFLEARAKEVSKKV